MLEDRNALRDQGAGKTPRIVQRVDRARMGRQRAADEIPRAGLGRRFLAEQDADRPVAELLAHDRGLGGESGQRHFVMGAAQIAAKAEIGILDRMGLDEAFHGRHRLVADLVHAAGHVEPVGARDARQRHAVLGGDDAPVAPARAPADAVGVDQQGLEPPLGQAQGGAKAGIARADDGDVGPVFALQPRRDARERGCRLGPERGRPSHGKTGAGRPAAHQAAAREAGALLASSASIASASSASVVKWKSGLVTSLGVGVPPKPSWPDRRSIQQTL